MKVSEQIESELADRLAFAFEHEKIVESVRRTLHIVDSSVSDHQVWRTFAGKLIHELHEIERQATGRSREVRRQKN